MILIGNLKIKLFILTLDTRKNEKNILGQHLKGDVFKR